MDFEQFQSYLNLLFTPQQQTAIIITTLVVMALTQVFKKVYFGFSPERRKGKKAAIIWLTAFIIGLICGIIGYYIAIPKQPLWFWLFTGAVSGVASIGAFKFLIEIVWLKWLLRKSDK